MQIPEALGSTNNHRFRSIAMFPVLLAVDTGRVIDVYAFLTFLARDCNQSLIWVFGNHEICEILRAEILASAHRPVTEPALHGQIPSSMKIKIQFRRIRRRIPIRTLH